MGLLSNEMNIVYGNTGSFDSCMTDDAYAQLETVYANKSSFWYSNHSFSIPECRLPLPIFFPGGIGYYFQAIGLDGDPSYIVPRILHVGIEKFDLRGIRVEELAALIHSALNPKKLLIHSHFIVPLTEEPLLISARESSQRVRASLFSVFKPEGLPRNYRQPEKARTL